MQAPALAVLFAAMLERSYAEIPISNFLEEPFANESFCHDAELPEDLRILLFRGCLSYLEALNVRMLLLIALQTLVLITSALTSFIVNRQIRVVMRFGYLQTAQILTFLNGIINAVMLATFCVYAVLLGRSVTNAQLFERYMEG